VALLRVLPGYVHKDDALELEGCVKIDWAVSAKQNRQKDHFRRGASRGIVAPVHQTELTFGELDDLDGWSLR
jgi:hypothetical protein